MNKKSFEKGKLRLKVVTPETIQQGHIIEEMHYLVAVGKYSKQLGQKPTRFQKIYEPWIELENETFGNIGHEELDYRFLKEDVAKRYIKDGDVVTVKLTPDGNDIAVNYEDKVSVRKWTEREPLAKHILNVLKTITGNRPAIQLVKDLSKRDIIIMTKQDLEQEFVLFGQQLRKNDELTKKEQRQLYKVEDHVSAFLADAEFFGKEESLEPQLKNEVTEVTNDVTTNPEAKEETQVPVEVKEEVIQ